jgi:hypothetical protein
MIQMAKALEAEREAAKAVATALQYTLMPKVHHHCMQKKTYTEV